VLDGFVAHGCSFNKVILAKISGFKGLFQRTKIHHFDATSVNFEESMFIDVSTQHMCLSKCRMLSCDLSSVSIVELVLDDVAIEDTKLIGQEKRKWAKADQKNNVFLATVIPFDADNWNREFYRLRRTHNGWHHQE
jgi:hypothetical protein